MLTGAQHRGAPTLLFVVLAAATFLAGTARAGTITLQTCFGQPVATPTWGHTASAGANLAAVDNCGQGERMQLTGPTGKTDSLGAYAQWVTVVPPSMMLTGVAVPDQAAVINPYTQNVNGGSGYNVRLLWDGGSYALQDAGSCCGKLDYVKPVLMGVAGRYFIVQAACNGTSGDPACELPAVGSTTEVFGVKDLTLAAEDDTAPQITPVPQTNLWNQTGKWVRGAWPLASQASDDSGVCDMWDQVDNTTIQGPITAARDSSSWTQCPSPQTMTQTVDTTAYPDGPLTLTLGASDAAQPANSSSPTETLDVDNQPVTLELSGPQDAPTTAGTQYVTATASAGPSGVAGIWCSVDGSPFAAETGNPARIAVQGIGAHTVQCYARNNALDANGNAASSPTKTWSMTIRQPSVSTVSFSAQIDSLRCHRVKERVRIPAHWVTGHANGQKIKVRLPAQTKVVTVRRCHPKIVHKRVKVGGHEYVERIVVLPHTVQTATKRVGFGQSTTISGWLGTTQGDALGGQTVSILTAPSNGSQAFEQVTTAQTTANGTWTATLPAGPSRVVQAQYAGSTTVEPATGTAEVRVPASLTLRIHPQLAHWGGTISITGRLRGCCVPNAGELVELHVGWSGGSAEIGHVYAETQGRFRTKYTFLRGRGTQTYRFWATTATESDYPYLTSKSRRIRVSVS